MVINVKNQDNKKTVIGLIAVFIIALLMLGITFMLGYPIIRFVENPDDFRGWLDRFGIFGDIIFVAILVFQIIVAIIPGEPFEIFAGYGFGIVKGTFLCLIGAFIGTFIVFTAVRKWGVKIFDIFFSREKMNNLKFLRNTKSNRILLFFIFLLPGTPKDLLTFFIGLTDIKLTEWLAISTIARIPSVITSVIGGATLQEQNYMTSLAVFGITILLSVLGLMLYNAIIKYKNRK